MASINAGTDAVLVWDLRFFSNPNAIVDDAAEMLDEVRVDLRRDGGDGFAGEYLDVGVGLRRLCDEMTAAQGGARSGQGGGLKKGSARSGFKCHQKTFSR